MSLRALITIVVACAVGVAVAATSGTALVVFDQDLRRQLDRSLRAQAERTIDEQRLGGSGNPGAVHEVPVQSDPTGGFFQTLVFADGPSVPTPGPDIRLAPIATEVARGGRAEAYFDQTIDGSRLRIYVRHLQPGVALVVGRTTDDIDTALSRMRLIALGAAGAGVGLALLLGWAVGLVALRPISRVTTAIETASTTRDLAHRVAEERADELGRLARSVNDLLGALDESQRARQQLVADASHELRSPLASLRTNVEVLAATNNLPESDRRPLVRDIVAQIQELTALIEDLVALARDRADTATPERVPLDELVDNAINRIRPRARAKGIRIEPSLTICAVIGVAADLERAVTNLLDNAVKWSPDDQIVEVSLTSDGELTVCDHGPGISTEDQPHVFDRFYRAADARSLPGSGLGLAIVRKVVEEHGGSVTADRTPGGGARLRLTIPPVPENEHAGGAPRV